MEAKLGKKEEEKKKKFVFLERSPVMSLDWFSFCLYRHGGSELQM